MRKDKSIISSLSPQNQEGTDRSQNNQAEDTIKHLRSHGHTLTEVSSNAGQLSKVIGQHLPKKTWRDWMQLLLIPFILVAVWSAFNWEQSRISETNNQRQHDTGIRIAQDQQEEAALQTYLKSMSDLLLTKHLRESGENDEVRNVAREDTLAVLPRLDGKRKGYVLLFLAEAGLIDTPSPIIILGAAGYYATDLSEVDLSGIYHAELYQVIITYTILDRANLAGVYLKGSALEGSRLVEATLTRANMSGDILIFTTLTGANLTGTDLTDADLTDADLTDADLTDANLTNASVTQEQLDEVKSLKGAIMPDGSKHP